MIRSGVNDASWSDQVARRLKSFEAALEELLAERPSPGSAALQDSRAVSKFPATDFDYLDELAGLPALSAASESELVAEVQQFFRGAMRPESQFNLFNMVPRPTPEAAAAASLCVLHNVNSLMDAFGGGSLLVEQKVARTIGRWAGWPEAMGISCNGGKITMFYALRAALSRAQPQSLRSGVAGRNVVLCTAGAHYSVEHVAALVGLGSANCIRVEPDASGGMAPQALRDALCRARAEGATIAAVVCSGGTTIDFACEDTARIVDVIDSFTSEHRLSRAPYLHFDAVIGWIYLAFNGMTPDAIGAAVPDGAARRRITEVVRRCSALERFDSLGVDFHKTGLCPYPSSFFIARDNSFMDDLGTGDYHYEDADFRLGSFRAYRFTLENSRPGQGILAAWVNLRSLGIDGLREHLASLHRARAQLEGALARHGGFRVLNTSSLGWEVVVDLPLPAPAAGESHDDVAVRFIESCWARVRAGHETPLFSIVPGYRNGGRVRNAFLLYPMAQAPPETWDQVVAGVAAEVERYGREHDEVAPSAPQRWAKPIR